MVGSAGLFQSGEEKVAGDPVAVFNHLKSCHVEDEKQLLTAEFNLQEQRFREATKKPS